MMDFAAQRPPQPLTPPRGADDWGLREKVMGVDVIKLGMGIDQEADRPLPPLPSGRQRPLGSRHRTVRSATPHRAPEDAESPADPSAALSPKSALWRSHSQGICASRPRT